MAEGKKTFIFYYDWINMIKEMPDADAGQLLKHILSYVNDEDPATDNILVKMAFGHIQPMLKADLDKWDKQLTKYSEMGKESAKKRKATQVEPTLTYVEPTSTVNVNVNVNDNDNVNKENNIVFNFKKSLLKLGADEKHIDDWMKVRKDKKASNTHTALTAIINECDKHDYKISNVVKICAEKSWAGFNHSWLVSEGNGLSTKGMPHEPDKGWINTVGKDKELYQQACKLWRDNGWAYLQIDGSAVRRWVKKEL